MDTNGTNLCEINKSTVGQNKQDSPEMSSECFAENNLTETLPSVSEIVAPAMTGPDVGCSVQDETEKSSDVCTTARDEQEGASGGACNSANVRINSFLSRDDIVLLDPDVDLPVCLFSSAVVSSRAEDTENSFSDNGVSDNYHGCVKNKDIANIWQSDVRDFAAKDPRNRTDNSFSDCGAMQHCKGVCDDCGQDDSKLCGENKLHDCITCESERMSKRDNHKTHAETLKTECCIGLPQESSTNNACSSNCESQKVSLKVCNAWGGEKDRPSLQLRKCQKVIDDKANVLMNPNVKLDPTVPSLLENSIWRDHLNLEDQREISWHRSLPAAYAGVTLDSCTSSSSEDDSDQDYEPYSEEDVPDDEDVALDDECEFNRLPREIIQKVFSYFSQFDLCHTVALVCRKWTHFAYDPIFWQVLEIPMNTTMGSKELMKVCSQRAPLLKKLQLHGRIGLSTEEVNLITKTCPMLTDLDLGFIHTLDYDVIHCIVRSCDKMERLNLEGCNLVDHHCVQLLCELPRLRDLNLSHCTRLLDDSIIILAQRLPSLTALNIDGISWISDRFVLLGVVNIGKIA